MKKLILLDAYALIYRAYYALIRTPRINSKGMNTSAIFGFINTLEEVLKKEEPDYIGVAFDPKGGTFRHEIYPEYKAQREATPEDIRTAVPIIKQILEAYNIPILEIPGYEADDVIGTLATQAAQLGGIITYMLTPDKDYGQLVTDSVKMLRPNHGGGFEIMGPQEICSKYGISSPLQVIDLLGLMGDAADNVPGCPGVGEKTAVKIIGEFGSIDQLLERSNELKGALKTKVENNIEGIRFSKMLVTIKTDVPIQLDLDRLSIKPKDNTRLAEIFDELEFRGLKSKLNQTSADSTIKSDRTKPQLSATNDLQLDLFAPSPKPVETTTPHTSSIFDDTSFQTSTVTDSKPRIASDGTLIGFDIKKHIVSGEIKEVPEKLFDIMIAYYVLRPDRRIYDDGNYSDERRQQLEDEMKREGVYRVFQEIEMPLLPVLALLEP